ncbi:hypothetical protein EDB85DRAFT_2278794 [Lactarius pseudohatsudake]|nr:hypothetical protein EDB85DRAFT_1875129 [Lactarius pseudohatsudake]KAH9020301.1 hypothetical protein EDB85DRAFT_2278794 [Lactarius pseudohatsudake]
MSTPAPQTPPTVLTYSYNSKLVYVSPGESYEQAIEFAQEAFPELRDVDRSLIYLEIRVILKNQAERPTARIHQTAWSPVVTTLSQYEIVEIHVASPPSSSPPHSVAQPPPYISETGGFTTIMKGSPTSKNSLGPAPIQQSRMHTFIARLFRQRSS